MKLEDRQTELETSLGELYRIVGATHDVCGLILSDQQQMRKEMFEFKRSVDKRFDQLELLIRQTQTQN